MLALVSYLLAVLSVLLAIPVAILFLEVVAAIALPRRDHVSGEGRRRRVAVLVPAHNESAGLLPTISDITAQLRAGDRLLVVADNCTDETSAVAAAAGAEVVERIDPNRIGKGYALDFGLQYLSIDPPDILIVIDADCRLSAQAIHWLEKSCAATGRPAQALDLMTAPDLAPINYQVAEFAWRLKNWVRPLGLSNLGLPCQLMGTGMGFPWDVIRSAKLASGQIVEDLKLGLELAVEGRAPVFCPSAMVTSRFPLSVEGAESQRQRWEHGHIQTIVTSAPRYAWIAIVRRNLGLLALALDVAVPPVALLGLLIIALLAIAGVAVVFGASSAALIIALTSFLALAICIALSWLAYGRDILPGAALLSLGSYGFGKIRTYRRLLSRGFVTQWIRTDRRKAERPNDVPRRD